MTKVLNIISAMTFFALTAYGGGKVSSLPRTETVLVDAEASPFYLGVGFSMAKFKSCGNSGCVYEDKTYGALLRVGYDFNRYVGVEARVMRTFLGEGPFGGAPLQHIGLFVKPHYAISDNFNIYGLLGYGYTKNLGNGLRLRYFDSDYGASAGLGLEYNFSVNADGSSWSLFGDYQRLLLKTGAPDMDVISFGVKRSY